MAQHDYNIANASGATVRADINALAQAIAELNSGATAPSVTFPYMWWADTTSGTLKQRNAANTAWLTIAAGEITGTSGHVLGFLDGLNTWSAKNIFDQGKNNYVFQGASGGFHIIETAAAADNKRWDFFANVEAFFLNITNDANTVASTVMKIGRTGTTVDEIEFLGSKGIIVGSPIGGGGVSGDVRAQALYEDGNRVKFTKKYTSPEQTITAAGPLTLAHGLGVSPELVQCRLINKTAEMGYSIGQEVLVKNDNHSTAAANNFGLSIVPDSTNLLIRYGAGTGVFVILDKGTGVDAPITPGNWKLIVKAWA